MDEAPLEYARIAPATWTPRDLFGVVVRTIGLLLLLWGCYSIVFELIALIATFPRQYPPRVVLLFGAAFIAAGIGLLRAEWVVRIAYGRR